MRKISFNWQVKHDGSALFIRTVIKYLNENNEYQFQGNADGFYYGEDDQEDTKCFCDDRERRHCRTLTIDQFIKLTKGFKFGR